MSFQLSQIFIDSIKEYEYHYHCTIDLCNKLVLRDVLFEWHPYNYISYNSTSPNESFVIRDDYFRMFRELDLVELIINENRELHMRKSVKKKIGIFAVTISPEKTDCLNKLVDCVKKITLSKCVNNMYGVFEYGRTRENFHTHFVLNFTDRNGIRNFRDSIKKKYPIFKIEEMSGPVHLLKTLRYFHKIDKLNRGIINKGQLNIFEDIAEGDAPINFIIDSKEKIYNIN